MTTEEFSNQFDVLCNSYAHSAEFGDGISFADLVFDEYEKSVALTASQKEFVISWYSGRTDYGFSFEEKEEVREALDSLVRSKEYLASAGTSTPSTYIKEYKGKVKTAYKLPENLLYIIFEEVKFSSHLTDCTKGKVALIVPATHDELWHRLQNPFRGTSKSRVLRVNVEDNLVELISDYPIGSYLVRYIEEPKPIILTDLPEELTIEGLNSETNCKLPSIVHHIILDNAVRFAIRTRLMTQGGKAESKQ